MYDSHEERVNKTLQSRIKNFGISSKTLWVTDSNTFEEICERVERNYFRIVIIDSVQEARFTTKQLEEFKKRFAKRHIILIMISFGTALMKTKGADDLLFASDIKIFIKNGKLTSMSRYLSTPCELTLFESLVKDEPAVDESPAAPDLFAQPEAAGIAHWLSRFESLAQLENNENEAI